MKVKVTVLQDDRVVKRTKVGRMEFIFKMILQLRPRIDVVCDLLMDLNAGKTITYDTKPYTIEATQVK